MIHVPRTSKPSVLVQNENAWLDAFRNATTASDRKKAQNRYNHHQVRAALERMFRGKCAFCESRIRHVGHPHIEHFRPKALFPDLTFCWDNLLLACGMCNSTRYKGDKFPETDEGGPFVDPCHDDPEDHLDFYYDSVAKIASVYGKTERGEITEKTLGLNRPDLRTHRS